MLVYICVCVCVCVCVCTCCAVKAIGFFGGRAEAEGRRQERKSSNRKIWQSLKSDCQKFSWGGLRNSFGSYSFVSGKRWQATFSNLAFCFRAWLCWRQVKEGSRSLLRADREARVAGSSQVESCKSDLLFLDSGQAEWQTQTKRHECQKWPARANGLHPEARRAGQGGGLSRGNAAPALPLFCCGYLTLG